MFEKTTQAFQESIFIRSQNSLYQGGIFIFTSALLFSSSIFRNDFSTGAMDSYVRMGVHMHIIPALKISRHSNICTSMILIQVIIEVIF